MAAAVPTHGSISATFSILSQPKAAARSSCGWDIYAFDATVFDTTAERGTIRLRDDLNGEFRQLVSATCSKIASELAKQWACYFLQRCDDF
jgi:hypothetical protein